MMAEVAVIAESVPHSVLALPCLGAPSTPTPTLADSEIRPTVIPESIWRELVWSRPTLNKRGSVHAEALPSGNYRYRLHVLLRKYHRGADGISRTRERQRKIDLGSAEVAEAVQELLSLWRHPDVLRAYKEPEAAEFHAWCVQHDAERKRQEEREELNADWDEALVEDAEREDDRRWEQEQEEREAEYEAMAEKEQKEDAERRAAKTEAAEAAPAKPACPQPEPAPAPSDPDTELIALCDQVNEGILKLTSRLPQGILDEIIALKDVLAQNGSVQVRRERDRHTSFRVRVRVPHEQYGRVQKSIPLPLDARAAMGVALLIWSWRVGTFDNDPRAWGTARKVKAAIRGAKRALRLKRYVELEDNLKRFPSVDGNKIMHLPAHIGGLEGLRLLASRR